MLGVRLSTNAETTGDFFDFPMPTKGDHVSFDFVEEIPVIRPVAILADPGDGKGAAAKRSPQRGSGLARIAGRALTTALAMARHFRGIDPEEAHALTTTAQGVAVHCDAAGRLRW